MGYSVSILNTIWKNSSQEYQERIPQATKENIINVGVALQNYTPLYNEFCDALINKIGKTILESKLFENRLARFKQGAILDQKDVEEIFIEMAKAESSYDPNGANPLGRRENPDVKALYHRMNRQDVYAISIGDVDFLRVFKSEATLDSFISGLINSVYSGANYDEWLAMKNLICTYKDYAVAEVTIGEVVDDGEGMSTIYYKPDVVAKNFVKVARKLAVDMSFATTKFNGAGVRTWSNPSEMVLLVDKDLLTEIDVEVLSKAYNMGKTDVQFEVVPMDGFNTLMDMTNEEGNSIYGSEGPGSEFRTALGILVDKDWFRVFDTLSHFEPQRNAHGLFTNYFYHVHQILSASLFKNAVLITGAGS